MGLGGDTVQSFCGRSLPSNVGRSRSFDTVQRWSFAEHLESHEHPNNVET